MKKFALTMMILAGLVGSMVIENTYDREAKVFNVKDGITTFEDGTGNLWEYETTDYEQNSKVILKMSTNNTDSNIYDDEILQIIIK